MIALICDSWENFWREVLSPWGEIKTFSDGVTLAYYLQHGGPCDLAVVAVDGADGMNYCDYARHIRPGVRVLWVTQDADFAPPQSAHGGGRISGQAPAPGRAGKCPAPHPGPARQRRVTTRKTHWQGGTPLPPEGSLRGLIPLVPHFYMEAI